MAIRSTTVTASPAVGGNGVATVSAVTAAPVSGILLAVHLTYLDSPPSGTTDITITSNAVPTAALVTVTDGATNGWRYPRAEAVLASSGAAISGSAVEIPVDDYLTVTIAQANAGDGVTAVIVWDDLR